MYIKFKLLIILLIITESLIATPINIKGRIVEYDNPSEPIIGANLHWAGTSSGTTSDIAGDFTLMWPGKPSTLVVSFVGYRADSILIENTELFREIPLKKNIELGEVVIRERQKGQYLSTLDPIQTTKVTVTELQRAACCNLSESFETNASVDVAYTDAVTGAQQIKMLGLAGIYVQTISENIPSIRGMAAPYGLGYIPGPWMESIQISKGTSSVINGYEAITGQINVEYKKPYSDERLHVNLYANNELRSEANINASVKFNDSLSTMILLHVENQNKETDYNNDYFVDMPRMQQINFINRWYKERHDGGEIQVGFKILEENRLSGQVGAFNNYDSDLYRIGIRTSRYEVFAKNGYLLNRIGTSLGMQLSGWYHKQDAYYGRTQYNGTQYNGYFNLIYQGNFGSDLHTFKTGASLLADSYNESLNSLITPQNEWVPGIYYEYNFNLKHKLNILAGIRADYSSVYGLFFTPRLHAKWDINEHFTWRASAGKGYRTALPLAENNYLLASSREIDIAKNLKQEEAVNLGTSLNIQIPLGEQSISLTLDYYHTNFINQVVKDLDENPNKVLFYNLEGLSYSNSFQAELMYEIFRGFTLNAAYRINDVKQTTGGLLMEQPLNSRYKGLLSASYATRLNKWQFDLTGQFNGGGRMPLPDTLFPLWEKEFPAYTIVNGQITRNHKKWSFYAGVENLLNFMIHNPIIAATDPWGKNFDGTMIWGPVHGRKIYAGIRYTIHSYN
jgi:outer membrane receptor for ferrienterochelin and colicins